MNYKVFGPNSHDGAYEFWHFKTLDEAKTFAEFIAGEEDAEYKVFEFHGSYERQKPPVKFTPPKP